MSAAYVIAMRDKLQKEKKQCDSTTYPLFILAIKVLIGVHDLAVHSMLA
jgi:hypothetical protein